MKNHIFLHLLCTLTLLSRLSAQKDSSSHYFVYPEIYGHNYYGYWDETETGVWSVNFGYRIRLTQSRTFTTRAFFSAGWGTFLEKHSTQVPWQPRVYFSDRVHFFPLEIAFQIGKGFSFFELGFAATFAFGKHDFLYHSNSGSSPPPPFGPITRSQGVQFIPRADYVFILNKLGIFFRIGLTPHYFPSSYTNYEGYPLFKPRWLPFGCSIGACF